MGPGFATTSTYRLIAAKALKWRGSRHPSDAACVCYSTGTIVSNAASPDDHLDRAMTFATAERADILSGLIDAEQDRFRRSHPRSAKAWQDGKQHFLYGGP